MSSSAAQSKPMTTQRREKKRQHDREAQRAARDKTRKYISHLEGLVGTLQAANSSPKRMQELLDQLANGHETISRLQRSLTRINKIVNDAIPPDTAHSNVREQSKPVDEGHTQAASESPASVFPEDAVLNLNEGCARGKGEPDTMMTPGNAPYEYEPLAQHLDVHEVLGVDVDAVSPEDLGMLGIEASLDVGSDSYSIHVQPELGLPSLSSCSGQRQCQDAEGDSQQLEVFLPSQTPSRC